MHSAVWTYALEALALVVAVWAGWIDWHSRRIPNWLTVPALLTGIAVSTLGGGWTGTKASLEGAGLGLGLLLPFVLLRGLGAGDWKLMGAMGAFLGWAGLVVVLLGTVFIAGLMAVVQVIRSRRIKETLRNLWVLLLAMVTFGIRGQRENITLDNPGLMTLPFGVATAMATIMLVGTLSVLRILHL